MTRLAWLLVGLTLVGCQVTSPPTASPSPTPTQVPSVSPSPSAAPSSDLGCHSMNGAIDMPTPTIESLSNHATAVVVGYFVDYGKAYWNTPNGSAPDLATFRQGRSEIRTPLVVALPRIVRGSQSVSEHMVLAHEGKIGCVRFSGYVTPLFAVGGRYVFFLYGSTDSTGATDDDLAVLIVWPVDDDGIVHTAYDGEVSLQDLEDRLKPAQP